MFISDVSIKHPVFATMMMVALVVLGIVSYKRLAIDEYPDITYPVVIVQTSYPGSSPEVMERDVSRPIEEALNTVQGIYELTSTSIDGISIVRVQLNLGVDVLAAQQDVQAKIARIRRSLPPTINEPIVAHFDPNDSPIMSIAVQSPTRPIRELTDLASESVTQRLEAVTGVAAVNLSGGEQRTIRIQLSPDAMRSYGITPPEVMTALQRENQEVPAGRIDRGATETLVRIRGRVIDPRAFGDVVVAVRNNSPIHLRDLGTVVDGTADKRTAALLDGNQTVALDIQKIAGSNTVAVADSVRSAVADLEGVVPSDVKLTVIRDDSQRIRDSLADVQLNILLGAILTIAIVYLFLNSWRSTIITGLTLPVSVISAFFIMWLFNFTVNTMTLLALSLAIGLLIDDAIVVRENIVRHVQMGKDHVQASMEGTDEIGMAVISTTLAVMAVFIPVAFMGGIIGKIFFQFGVTVAFAVLVSLFVSFTLDPMLSSVWPDPELEHEAGDGGAIDYSKVRNPIRMVALKFNDWFERMADGYPAWLKWALGHRAIVIGGAVASVVIALAITSKLGFTWLPDTNSDEFSVSVKTAPGSTLEYTMARALQVSTFLRKQPETVFTYTTIGSGLRGTPNAGSIYVRLKPAAQRSVSLQDIQGRLRVALKRIPGITPVIQNASSIFGGRGQPIQINVQGPEESRLKISAAQVLEAIRSVPGVAEPNSSDQGNIPQLNVDVDRERAWASGVGIAAVASTLQPLFTGQRATQWEDRNGFSHDVIVVYPDSLRQSVDNVASIPISSSNSNPSTGRPVIVPLSQVADISLASGPQQIDRRNLERQISISAGVLPGYNVGDVAAQVQKAIDAVGLPAGYHTVFGGDVRNLNETKGYIGGALLLAVVFIYLIIASLFGSFLQPFSILMSLPLSFIGVALALWVTHSNLNIMSMIGIIMLMGLVVKNGILLVDFTIQSRESGTERMEALLHAGRTRIRPIIMTSTAMIFGMIPLALALGPGADQRAPLARAVIGGLITSTVLTLFVVPVAYTLIEDGIAFTRHTAPDRIRGFAARLSRSRGSRRTVSVR
ncbi:MAG: efflux RND transporter permease subunit [Gemmatimonadaceae bacterium]